MSKLRDHLNEQPVALIDGSPLLYINGNKPNYKDAVDEFMWEFLGHCDTDRYIGVLDEGKSFRTKLNTDYKAQRSKSNLLDVCPFFYRVKDYLIDKYAFNRITELEGDDALAIMNKRFNPDYTRLNGSKIERNTFNSVIISIDKDLLQLSGAHLNIRYRRSEIVTVSGAYLDINEKKKFSGTSYKLLYAQAMMGDSADNIKGLPKYGQVTSYKLLKDVQNEDEARAVVLNEYKKVYCGSTDDPEQELENTMQLIKLIDTDDKFITPPIQFLSDRLCNEDL